MRGLYNTAYASREQALGLAEFDACALSGGQYGNRHEPTVQRDVEQRFSVATPARLGPTISGHGDLSSWSGK